MVVRARAPVRISFAGGGTDVSPFTEEHEGCVVNVAINKYAYTTLEDDFPRKEVIELESIDLGQKETITNMDINYNGNVSLLKAVMKKFLLPGATLTSYCEVPPRSGLGSSASVFVSAIGVFDRYLGKGMTEYDIAELAYKLEREELKNPGGRQDQYAATFGGFNFIEFKGNDFVRVSPLKLKPDTVFELEKSLILINIGERIDSGDIIKDQTKNYIEGKNKDALLKNKESAIAIRQALLNGDLLLFGELLDRAWKEKKKFSSMISNAKIDEIYSLAQKHGALGGKVSGAGGGGHMILFCRPNSEYEVKKALINHGVKVIPFSFDFKGLQTWVN